MPSCTFRPIDPDICRAARALINWSVSRLAREAGISSTVIFDLERGRVIDDGLGERLVEAFRNAGIAVVMRGDRQIGVQRATDLDSGTALHGPTGDHEPKNLCSSRISSETWRPT